MCIETTRGVPSGRKPSPEGHSGTAAITSGAIPGTSRCTVCACMSENQTAPLCQRTPSGKVRPSTSVSELVVSIALSTR